MIRQAQEFISQRIEISGLFYARARPRVFEHAFDDGGGAFAVVVDFGEVLLQIIGDRDDFGVIARLYFLLHLAEHFSTNFGEVVDEVQRILNLMGNARREFTKRGEFFGLDELGLGGF